METIGAVLKNDNQKIELKVTGYEMPVPTKYFEDNNWLVLSCQSIRNGISMQGEFPCFMTMELQRLKALLEQFQSGIIRSVSWNGTEPNFTVNLCKNKLLTIFFYAEYSDCEITFQKYATAKDVEELIDFCSDALTLYPVRDIGIK